MPLVVGRPKLEPAEVLRRLGVDPADRRPRVLFGIRGSVPIETLAAAAANAPDLLFVCPANEADDLPPGVVPAPVGSHVPVGGLDFSDVLRACDVVLGKMGYGLVAECVASGTALLWPRRTGFREDEVTERDGPRFMRMRELPAAGLPRRPVGRPRPRRGRPAEAAGVDADGRGGGVRAVDRGTDLKRLEPVVSRVPLVGPAVPAVGLGVDDGSAAQSPSAGIAGPI
jgi:hypothetical protein